ncbi:collar/head-to-tail joining protein [Delftia phage IME-DE1]|uniref:Collar/head-to-tail joining protein n=1 Tax=Delftia phage IME-DE1 TaxID=1647385 RepID=A0A0F7IJV8_9CAUD|nr:collar/head-to-tail joining protein [Delftia phage IME-DE1]AKG94507.1 collar/head-to-tail joining protein [Delftia phage IME-DE1]
MQRSGERVTAEEIRYVANELEATLGGVYSVLSGEFQKPVVERLLVDLQLSSKIPDMPKEAVEPTVITGLDAIGRGQDLQKLQMFVSASQPAMQFVQGEINWSNFVLRCAEATGIDSTGLLLSPQERQQAQQAQLQQQAMQSAAQSAGAAAGQNLGAASTSNEDAMAAAAAQGM